MQVVLAPLTRVPNGAWSGATKLLVSLAARKAHAQKARKANKNERAEEKKEKNHLEALATTVWAPEASRLERRDRTLRIRRHGWNDCRAKRCFTDLAKRWLRKRLQKDVTRRGCNPKKRERFVLKQRHRKADRSKSEVD